MCVHNNKIYICGGNGIESIEMLNPVNNKFTLLSLRLPSPGKCFLFPYDEFIYILQKDKLFRIQFPKLNFSIVSTVENKD